MPEALSALAARHAAVQARGGRGAEGEAGLPRTGTWSRRHRQGQGQGSGAGGFLSETLKEAATLCRLSSSCNSPTPTMHLPAIIILSICACALGLYYSRKQKPAPPPCTRPPLPVELQLLILQLGIASLAHPDDHRPRTRFLSSYSRVSRGVVEVAQVHLSRTLRFTRPAAFERAMCALLSRPERQDVVEVVDVRFGARRTKAHDALEGLDLLCPKVRVLMVEGVSGFEMARLARWPLLERLHLGHCSAPDAFDFPLLDRLHLPRLTHFTTHHCTGFHFRFLTACPALAVLAIDFPYSPPSSPSPRPRRGTRPPGPTPCPRASSPSASRTRPGPRRRRGSCGAARG